MTNLMCLKEKTKNVCSANILVQTLIELGVDSVFGYPGASILSVYNELAKVKSIKHYLVRHEQAAIHAAEGYARASGKTGVVLVTSGPGFTNTVTGIANAYADSTPVVILAGDVPCDNTSDKVFQNVDMVSIAQTCCKKTYKLTSADNVAYIIKEAFKEAESGVKGPVVVSLPRDVLEQNFSNNNSKTNQSIQNINKNEISESIANFTSMLNSAERPLLLIGGGCINASEEIQKLASIWQIPVVSTLMGIGIYPSKNDLYLGMIGLNGINKANQALKKCDLLIALGTAFSDRSTCKKNNFGANCKIVSVNIHHANRKFKLKIDADIKDFANECVNNKEKFFTNKNWHKRILDNSKEIENINDNPNYLQSSYVLETLSEYTKDLEPVVVTDVGQHQMLTAQFFKFNKPRKFITSGGLGTMGFGLPAAIGAYIAKPNNLILNITGDGSFQMNLQELATCREHHIPVKIIIMNNGYLGMVRQMQEKIYHQKYQVEMINPDFTKIAESYDLFAIRITKKEELISGIERAINHKGTAIIDIAINSFENI